jgi:hypothetical protein
LRIKGKSVVLALIASFALVASCVSVPPIDNAAGKAVIVVYGEFFSGDSSMVFGQFEFKLSNGKSFFMNPKDRFTIITSIAPGEYVLDKVVFYNSASGREGTSYDFDLPLSIREKKVFVMPVKIVSRIEEQGSMIYLYSGPDKLTAGDFAKCEAYFLENKNSAGWKMAWRPE